MVGNLIQLDKLIQSWHRPFDYTEADTQPSFIRVERPFTRKMSFIAGILKVTIVDTVQLTPQFVGFYGIRIISKDQSVTYNTIILLSRRFDTANHTEPIDT